MEFAHLRMGSIRIQGAVGIHTDFQDRSGIEAPDACNQVQFGCPVQRADFEFEAIKALRDFVERLLPHRFHIIHPNQAVDAQGIL